MVGITSSNVPDVIRTYKILLQIRAKLLLDVYLLFWGTDIRPFSFGVNLIQKYELFESWPDFAVRVDPSGLTGNSEMTKL